MWEIVDALRKLQDVEESQKRDFGDVAAILKQNPLLCALMNHLLDSLYTRILGELDRRMVPPDRELLTIEEVADMMHKSVAAVRKLRDRGRLDAIPHRINGRVMFTKEAVHAAILGAAARENRQNRFGPMTGQRS